MADPRNRFRIPLAPVAAPAEAPAARRSGPMGTAAREVGETLAAATEAQVEARRQNAADARAFRDARDAGLVLERVALDAIRTDDLARDRLELDRVAASDEMEELKASIRARGQREPLELYRDTRGRLQLKKGWRRLTALRALHAETGDARFAEAVARIDGRAPDRAEARIALYVDMVEENAIREDLSFAEMAQLVITARDDARTGFGSYDEALTRLYGSLHKVKRYYIKQFVTLMHCLGPVLPFPRAVPRDIGVELGRLLRERPGLGRAVAARLDGVASAEAQNAALAAALAEALAPGGGGDPAPVVETAGPRPAAPPPLRFRHGGLTVTASATTCRIALPEGLRGLPRDRIEAAVAAFRAALAAQD
jgi:ParB family chromosome partitioning protein